MTLIASSKLTVIVGLGVTGLSVARYLQRKNVLFCAMDSRNNPPGLLEFQKLFPSIALSLGSLDQDTLNQASEIILSPGVSVKTPEIVEAINAGASVIGDVELFAREATKPIIAITGSNAKTTVTTLVGEMAKDAGLKAVVAGNIGLPVLDLLEENYDIYILELSSFQLETTYSLKAEVATVLNISMDHMDRYSDLSEYYRAKQRIYFNAKTVVINRDDQLTHPPIGLGVSIMSFGLDKPDRNGFGVINRQGEQCIAYEFKSLLEVKAVKLAGKHNLVNCLSALALGLAAKLPLDSMLNTLKRFAGLPHRCQVIATIGGVRYINDSKATNVGATLAAVDGFAQDQPSIILIAGGDGKEADFSPLKSVMMKAVKLLVLIGRDAQKIADIVKHDIKVLFASSLSEAVTLAKSSAVAGDTVLLSPACASFDMFKGYEDRGNQFIDAVKGEVL